VRVVGPNLRRLGTTKAPERLRATTKTNVFDAGRFSRTIVRRAGAISDEMPVPLHDEFGILLSASTISRTLATQAGRRELFAE
jgi:hypothetical protein